ncbi:hypothetical protein T09_6970 [Trichinella sp. T9]|nr:hypothetical protein T09_6970 [Trichinella sp. T9]
MSKSTEMFSYYSFHWFTDAMKIQTRMAKQAKPKSGLSGVIFAGRFSFCPRIRSILYEH